MGHGLVSRTFAKMCPELGVERSSFAVHHKSHIRKVMGHATVGICFTDSPELGCEGFVISLNRCQGFRLCRKTTKAVTKNAVTGRNESKNNAVVNLKGDLVLEDCNVTGTDTGTPSNPKFALKGLWEYSLLPQLDALLVAPDGPCAGAIVCHQEDNAGPWDNCSSAMVCRAFIHAFRIMRKIMEEEGNSSWLATGAPHCNVRSDFIDTPSGIKPRVVQPVYLLRSECESRWLVEIVVYCLLVCCSSHP